MGEDMMTNTISYAAITTNTATEATTATISSGFNYSPINTNCCTGTPFSFDSIATSVKREIDEKNQNTRYLKPGEEVIFTFTYSDNHDWNTKPGWYNSWTLNSTPFIANINIIVPDKVVEVTIFDGTPHTYKQVCKDPDIFDFKYALALAWAKYENEKGSFGSRLNSTGLERAASRFIKYSLDYNKEFDRAIKAYNKHIAEKEKEENEKAERQAIIERRRAKNKKRKEKMRVKKRQEEVDIITRAIIESRGK
jgi:hypothetical protein